MSAEQPETGAHIVGEWCGNKQERIKYVVWRQASEVVLFEHNIDAIDKRKDKDLRVWLFNMLDIPLDRMNKSHTLEEYVTAAVLGAAAGGNMAVLERLRRRGLWRSEDLVRGRSHVIEASYPEGHLLDLARAYNIPLESYPHHAQDLVEKYRTWLSLQAKRIRSTRMSGRNLCGGGMNIQVNAGGVSDEGGSFNTAATATLLANLLHSPCPGVADFLDDIVEEMVVPKAEVGEILLPEARLQDFPRQLEPIFIQRKLPRIVAKNLTLLPRSRKLAIPTEDGGSLWVDTSEVLEVTCEGMNRLKMLIPQHAETYVFIHPCQELPLGGFFYRDSEERPLIVNELVSTPQHHAFMFANPVALSEEDSAKIRPHAAEVRSKELMSCGATHVAWVHNDRELSIDLGDVGCFCFFFEDAKGRPIANARLYPVAAVAEVVDRARVSWEVNAFQGTRSPNSLFLENRLAMTTDESWKWMLRVFGDGKSGHPESAKFARLSVPNIVCANVLNALAKTPQTEVPLTLAAKAIVHAAWNQVFMAYVIDAFLLIIMVAAQAYVTYYARSSHKWDDRGSDPWYMASMVVITGSTFFKLVQLCLLSRARASWSWSVIDLRRLPDIVGVVINVWLTCQLALQAHSDITRVLLALAACILWLKVFRLMQCSQSFGEGSLPILLSFRDGTTFGLVLLLGIVGFTHAFYCISNQGFFVSFFGRFGLSTIGDHDLNRDILGTADMQEGEIEKVDLESWQYGFYFVAAFTLHLGMLNIFIGVMGQAYEKHQARSLELFVRERAAVATDYFLMAGIWRGFFRCLCGQRCFSDDEEDKYVWCTFRDPAEETEHNLAHGSAEEPPDEGASDAGGAEEVPAAGWLRVTERKMSVQSGASRRSMRSIRSVRTVKSSIAPIDKE